MSLSLSPTPGQDFALAKEEQQERQVKPFGAEEQISAADYDPSLDRREDEHKRLAPPATDASTIEEVEEEVEEEDDLDDMFAIAEKKVKKVKKIKKVAVGTSHSFTQFLTCSSTNQRHLL